MMSTPMDEAKDRKLSFPNLGDSNESAWIRLNDPLLANFAIVTACSFELLRLLFIINNTEIESKIKDYIFLAIFGSK